ncbi:MAG: DNA-directed RNA polymerase subunit beta [candidate division Zixibacteria bacterium DG_27]|nr:MAG: DNA-directed RNA polymerase subunit beta [candidate division Zixibacteria bacterium DG_27]
MAEKKLIQRRSFSKLKTPAEMPHLLEVQIRSYEEFLQPQVEPEKREKRGLQAVFESIFPITDVHENSILEFLKYTLGRPRYTIAECRERNMTYAVPLKATLRLISKASGGSKEVKDVIEQEVFLGELPLITLQGTFIINGAERVVVSQLHRSPGVFFDEEIHPNGKRLFSARIIPYRGSWVEFEMDINDCLYVHIDSRRRLPATTLLRALGYSDGREILGLFYPVEALSTSSRKLKAGEFRLAETLAHPETGEVLTEVGEVLTEEVLGRIKEFKISKVAGFFIDPQREAAVIPNTFKKDTTSSEEEALFKIYTLMRPGDPPTMELARALLERMFFNPKRYDLGEVGRHMINQRLGLDTPLEQTTLTREDFIVIIRYLLKLRAGQGELDDIDHLGNRRARSVGELLANQFSVGLSRMARTIRERMSLKSKEGITPHELVNARTVSAVIVAFFGSSQLSQFMDQTNPLAELTHKRRLSALGPGGLTRERAGFKVRDVHHTHYGRMCPIETPEGPNIGLIASLSTYARINSYGFLETPYRKVIRGRVTDQIEYLTADVEDHHIIAPANEPLDPKGHLINTRVQARHRGDFPVVSPEEIHYMDVSPKQLVSVAAALIPFLEHDDANRALMGSNMQRQAVPLLTTEAPIVGTGIEAKVASDSGAVVIAERDGLVEYVDSSRVVIRPTRKGPEDLDLMEFDEYPLIKFHRSNQDTCINQRPHVEVGDRVKAGLPIADGPAVSQGELALGVNVLVGFVPWRGYNFEDAIIVSERLVGTDKFSSIHIEEFELQVRDTKRGAEELTREIPNVSEEAVANLDEMGIVRTGAEVEAGDILVGKITPKGETELSPEEKLLRAIFGEKAGDVRDASLKATPGMKGIVISTKVFSRKERSEEAKKSEKQEIASLRRRYKKEEEQILENVRHRLEELLSGQVSKTVRLASEGSVVFRSGHRFREGSFEGVDPLDLTLDGGICENERLNSKVRVFLKKARNSLQDKKSQLEVEIEKAVRGVELPPGVVQLVKVLVATKRKLSVGDKMAGRHGNKGVVAKVVPEEDMPYLPDGRHLEMILNPLGIPSRMNVGQLLETHLGWASDKLGEYVSSSVFDGASLEEVRETLKRAGLPESGKSKVYDGRTGEPLDREITVGQMYMMKLSHLVDDKIHARSIGPYSLVTQQPLGGKAQFGGQRFGEMEVWALEAYGAAYTLQEILTVKSDDVAGRSRIYEAIVKGENPPEPGVPESFNVLVKELQSLGLDVELIEK